MTPQDLLDPLGAVDPPRGGCGLENPVGHHHKAFPLREAKDVVLTVLPRESKAQRRTAEVEAFDLSPSVDQEGEGMAGAAQAELPLLEVQ